MVDIGHLDVPGAGVLEVRVHGDHDVVTELATTCHASLPATCHVSRSPAGHVHVLARVVAADHGRGRAARRGHRERVVDAVSCHAALHVTRVSRHVSPPTYEGPVRDGAGHAGGGLAAGEGGRQGEEREVQADLGHQGVAAAHRVPGT